MPPVNPLYDLAQSLLATVVAALGVDGLNVPGRRYATTGEIAADDCQQLVVSVRRIFIGLPGQEQTGDVKESNVILGRCADFMIALFRCVPSVAENGTAPTPAELDAAGKMVAQDGWYLLKALMDARKAGTLLPGCASYAIPALQPYGPEGGRAGWTLTISAQVS